MKISLLIFAVCLIVLAVLSVPFSVVHYDDGGTVMITSLTYTIVKWNRAQLFWNEADEVAIECFTDTDFYLFPNNFKSYEELWEARNAK